MNINLHFTCGNSMLTSYSAKSACKFPSEHAVFIADNGINKLELRFSHIDKNVGSNSIRPRRGWNLPLSRTRREMTKEGKDDDETSVQFPERDRLDRVCRIKRVLFHLLATIKHPPSPREDGGICLWTGLGLGDAVAFYDRVLFYNGALFLVAALLL